MEDLIVFVVLSASGAFAYKWSYERLWFKVGSLFDIVSTSSKKNSYSLTGELEIGPNENVSGMGNFINKIYTEYSLPSHKILQYLRVLFSLATMVYTVTIEIILWQIKVAGMDKEVTFITTWVWPLTAIMLSFILILLQPFFIIISLLNKFYNDRYDIDRLITVTCIILSFLIAILSYTNIGPFQYTRNILTRLSIGGVTVMASLSGLATVSSLYYNFLVIWHKIRNTSMSDPSFRNINNNNNSKSLLWTADAYIEEKIQDYEHNIEQNMQILKRLGNKSKGENSTFRAELIEKIAWYQLELGKLESQLQESPKVRNFKKIFEIGFIIYCLHKLIITFLKRIPYIIYHSLKYPNDYDYENFSENAASDPLAITIANILDFSIFRFNYQHDLDSLIKQISLFLSISLFLCCLSAVNTTISYVVTLLPVKFQILALFAMRNDDAGDVLPEYANNPNYKNKIGNFTHQQKEVSLIKNLVVSELTGVYVLATSLMVRSHLPFEVSQRLKELLGEKFTVPNIVIDSWFDEVYAFSCVFTFICIRIAERKLSSKKISVE
ncbi:YHR078W [Saccharomyces arboricola H-6]|uniref:YHR078W n=1 Tax=Saccharomyces arboricola (strain H-6 / AS 2.3317 / CBS 10644) TaxID=1160507 RepID=J8Q469_SACAR|nr:YHR078W [Saccharomyces arboricola H-6]